MPSMGSFCCKAARAARKKPAEFESSKAQFLQCIADVVKDQSMLALNLDQTAKKLVSTCEWNRANRVLLHACGRV